MAVAVAAVCWLAVPAGAAAQQAPDVSGLTKQVTAATTTTVASTGSAAASVDTAATAPLAGAGASAAAATGSVAQPVTGAAAPVTGVAERVAREAPPALESAVHGVTGAGRSAVDGVAGAGRSAVDPAVRDLTGAARSTVDSAVGGVTGAGRPQVGDSPRAGALPGPAGGGTSRASRLRLRRADTAELPGADPTSAHRERTSSMSAPLSLGAMTDFAGMRAPFLLGAATDFAGAASLSTGAIHAAPDGPLAPEPLFGAAGGSSASGASVSFALGGLALLLATLSIAGPALRRRLPRRTAIGWPAAFVPLLERPG